MTGYLFGKAQWKMKMWRLLSENYKDFQVSDRTLNQARDPPNHCGLKQEPRALAHKAGSGLYCSPVRPQISAQASVQSRCPLTMCSLVSRWSAGFLGHSPLPLFHPPPVASSQERDSWHAHSLATSSAQEVYRLETSPTASSGAPRIDSSEADAEKCSLCSLKEDSSASFTEQFLKRREKSMLSDSIALSWIILMLPVTYCREYNWSEDKLHTVSKSTKLKPFFLLTHAWEAVDNVI